MTPIHFTYRGIKGDCDENNFVTLAGMGCHYDQLSPKSGVKQLIDKLREPKPNLFPLFDYNLFEDVLLSISEEFDEIVIVEWCEQLHANPQVVTIADLSLLWYLHTERTTPSIAVKMVLKHTSQHVVS